jgi:malate dehydrogenase
LLDCSRASVLISKETGASVKDIDVIVLGTHGDTMVFSEANTKVENNQLKDRVTDGKIQEIIKKTKFGGGELVSLMGQSGYVAPGACIIKQVEAIIKDTKGIFCVPAFVDGQYGYRGFYIGVPAVIGKNGIEKIIEFPLPENEKRAFDEAVKHVKESVSAVEKLI